MTSLGSGLLASGCSVKEGIDIDKVTQESTGVLDEDRHAV